MQSVNVELFRTCVAFSLRMRKWNIRRKASIEDIQTKAEKNMLRMSKLLIAPPQSKDGEPKNPDEYDQIVSHQGETRTRIAAMSVPSFFQKAISLVRQDAIERIEAYLKKREKEHEELVLRFVQVYPQRIREAEPRLKDQFDPKDYPMVTQLPGLFGMSWNWIAFGVPDDLPKELFEIEKAKAEKMWSEASDQITLCLREGWKELIDAAVERLTPVPGEKPKIFRDSLIGNIIDFMDTFSSRNITNDQQLGDLIEKARGILTGIQPNDVRKNEDVRKKLADSFSGIQQTITGMITDMPARKFDFSDEEA